MIFLLIFAVILTFYVIFFYNKIISFKNRIRASIQEIGNQLKRQANLIPNLEESVKGYMKHEKAIFEDLTEARKAILEATSTNDPQALLNAEAKSRNTIGRFKALMENTPEIKAISAVTQLMEELRDTADKIMYARRVLIDLTADYNITISKFPNNLLAKVFKFNLEKGLVTPEEGEHLEVSIEETKTPKVEI